MALETTANQAASKTVSKKTKKKDPLPIPDVVEPAPELGSISPGPGDDASGIRAGVSEASNESAYVKELQRTVRNVNKKLHATQKVDAIIAENPGVSLDDLVATRKINNDQKAQALKKPALQAQLVQLEDQLSHYKKFEDEFQAHAIKQKELLEAAHLQELENLRLTAKAAADVELQQATRQKLLTLSKFLRAAAARRQVEDDLSEESRAFEGLLLLLYGGDNLAVSAAEKLINGSDEGVTSTDDQILNVSYSKIKELSEAYAPFAAEEAWRQEVADAEQTDTTGVAAQQEVGTDPTVAHAGLTELDAVPVQPGQQLPYREEPNNVDEGAANIAASGWDNSGSGTQDTMADSWVSVPRDLQETENHIDATTPTGNPSWADEPPVLPPATAAATAAAASAPSAANDGFHEVHHGRNAGRARGGRGRGGFRGEANGHRGRGGFRGDRSGEFRGRGRGGAGAGARGGAPRGGV